MQSVFCSFGMKCVLSYDWYVTLSSMCLSCRIGFNTEVWFASVSLRSASTIRQKLFSCARERLIEPHPIPSRFGYISYDPEMLFLNIALTSHPTPPSSFASTGIPSPHRDHMEMLTPFSCWYHLFVHVAVIWLDLCLHRDISTHERLDEKPWQHNTIGL